jgi:hypothetical protein
MTARRDQSPSDREDPIAASVRSHIRASDTPDLEDRVMREVRALPPHQSRPAGLRDAWSWLMAPRRITIPMRPAYGLAAGIAAIALFVFMGTGTPPATQVAMDEERDAAVVFVQFRLEAPEATAVQVAGTFSEWEPRHSLVEVAPGVWTATVPVRAGVHEYAFVVDGEDWRVDPYAPQVNDSFGGVNNRLPMLASSITNG